MTGSNIYGYIMNHNYDIDTKEDFELVDSILQKDRSGVVVWKKHFVLILMVLLQL